MAQIQHNLLSRIEPNNFPPFSVPELSIHARSLAVFITQYVRV